MRRFAFSRRLYRHGLCFFDILQTTRLIGDFIFYLGIYMTIKDKFIAMIKDLAKMSELEYERNDKHGKPGSGYYQEFQRRRHRTVGWTKTKAGDFQVRFPKSADRCDIINKPLS